MKTKILSALICIALGFTLSGCGAAPPKTLYEAPSETTTTETAAPSPENQEQTPSVTETPELPQTGTTPEQPKTETPETPQTATPPLAPTEATESDTLLLCTASSLNVRKSAKTSSALLGSLDKGDMVMPIKRSGDWYEIWYLNASAYVSASYVTQVSFEKTSDRIEQVISEGKKVLGIPYVYGAQRYHFGNGVKNSAYDGKSYDCSSLMQYIFKIGANVDLAMTSREQSFQGTEIAKKDIRRGDLLFFTNATRLNKTGLERIGHVALYLGDNIILHTASDHAVIEPINDLRSSYFISARRLL